tara:strand:- start:25492 stop:26442 length:951 start_codon:yes stop_codon:yes gene_type:complete
MPAVVETMAYAGKIPWHGLGTQVDSSISPEEMRKKAGLDWEVQKHPFLNPITGEVSQDWFTLVRDSDGKEFGPAGKSYVPVQNHEALDFFERFTSSGKMTLETAGALEGGRRVFVLAKTTSSFVLGKEDKVDSYLLCYHPHIWGQSLKIMWTPIRVVCMNTLVMALGQENAATSFRMPHVRAFDADMQMKAEQALGLADAQLEQFRSSSEILSSKEYTDQAVWKYFATLFQPSIVNEKKILPDMFNRTMEQVNLNLVKQPGAEYNKNTWWQALNAVTYYADHQAGRDRDKAMTSAWLGKAATIKRRALDSALKIAA